MKIGAFWDVTTWCHLLEDYSLKNKDSIRLMILILNIPSNSVSLESCIVVNKYSNKMLKGIHLHRVFACFSYTTQHRSFLLSDSTGIPYTLFILLEHLRDSLPGVFFPILLSIFFPMAQQPLFGCLVYPFISTYLSLY